MKRALLALFVVGTLALLSGCNTDRPFRQHSGQAECGCAPAGCGRPDCPHCGHRGGEAANDPGPSTGAVTYPYYTLRSPRDFLDRNPPSIGP